MGVVCQAWVDGGVSGAEGGMMGDVFWWFWLGGGGRGKGVELLLTWGAGWSVWVQVGGRKHVRFVWMSGKFYEHMYVQ